MKSYVDPKSDNTGVFLFEMNAAKGEKGLPPCPFKWLGFGGAQFENHEYSVIPFSPSHPPGFFEGVMHSVLKW